VGAKIARLHAIVIAVPYDLFAIDMIVRIRLFGKLKLRNCARTGNRTGLFVFDDKDWVNSAPLMAVHPENPASRYA
jgi:hypothetical protein